MKAVILIGGPGTRLRPLTLDRPKSVVPVLNRPAMEYTLAYLKKFGIEDIILTLSYLPDVIKEHFGNGSRFGVKLTYCVEEEPMGTAGAVKNVEALLDLPFFVLNGDIFTDLDLNDMLSFHRHNHASATISLTWVDDPSAFGVVETDRSQRVKKFIEKPPLAEATTHWINAGTYILEPKLLQNIPSNCYFMFEKGLFPSILKMGIPVYGYPFRGYFLDMGNPVNYFKINIDLLTSKIKSTLVTRKYTHGDDVVIDSSAVIIPPVAIDSGCCIEAGVSIKGPAVIGRNCRLNKGSSIENSILWDNVCIGADAKLKNCIVGSREIIEPESIIENIIITVPGSAPLHL